MTKNVRSIIFESPMFLTHDAQWSILLPKQIVAPVFVCFKISRRSNLLDPDFLPSNMRVLGFGYIGDSIMLWGSDFLESLTMVFK
jgi:hypothetical protein